MGQPTKFSPKTAAAICNRLATGMSLLRICEDVPGMPSRQTVARWLQTNSEFAKAYADARAFWADCVFEDLLELADDTSGDWKVVDGQKIPDRVAVDRARLKIDTRKWALARISPHKYADRMELTSAAGSPLMPAKELSEYDVAKGLAFLLAEGAAKEAKQQPSAQSAPIALLPDRRPVILDDVRHPDPRFAQSAEPEKVVFEDGNEPVEEIVPKRLRHYASADEMGLAGGGAFPKLISRRPGS